MNKTLFISIGEEQGENNVKFCFNVNRFDNELVKFQPFSNSTQIKFQATRPGMYSVDATADYNGVLRKMPTIHKYIPPDISYKLNNNINMAVMGRAIEKAHLRQYPESFKAILRSLEFDFLYFPDTSQKLFVLCPSAIERGKYPVPYFYRWQWAARGFFPGNVLVVSDPTFYVDESIEAGWFVGTKDDDATMLFSNIINEFCRVLKIPYKKIVFWGSSAGGFIAMQMCRLFPGSAAVSVNAQTDVYKFQKHKQLYQTVFHGMDDGEINREFAGRLTIHANLEKLSKNKVFLIQNILDEHHYKEHFLPLIAGVGGSKSVELVEGIHNIENSPFTCWLYSHKDGHMAETPEMAAAILKILPKL